MLAPVYDIKNCGPRHRFVANGKLVHNSDSVNLQNLPSRGANANQLKKSILAPPGYVIIDADSAQIEARVLAWLAEEDEVVEAFATGKDVYRKMASAIYGAKEEDVTKEQRFVGKTTILGCFGPDTKVLTNHGWKPIVKVQLTDMVWDGEEWVHHQGVVPKGLRQTIRAWGVDATPEHEILTGRGWREWSEVVTNHSLSQSAFDRANLPSWIGSSTPSLWVNPQGGTPSCGAAVDGKGALTGTTSRLGVPPAAIPAARSQATPSDIGNTKAFYRTKHIALDYLTEFRRALVGAITNGLRHTHNTAGVASKSMHLGALTVQRFLNTSLALMGGMTQPATLIASTMTKGTSRGIYASPHERKTLTTGAKSAPCNSSLMTYDIAYAGPRNRFTIATDAGPLIVHNCGYGMGAVKFQSQLKTFGVEVELDEARRIIDIYRRTNHNITNLWRQAQNALVNMSRGDIAPLGRHGVLSLVPEERAIRLPSGLLMRYDDLRFTETDKGVEFHYQTRKGRTRIYGGKVIENVCQAVARCLIAEQMLKISKRYKVVLTVHDAVAVCVREAVVDEARQYVEDCMRWVPEWAAGLPLNCESGVGKSYGDC
jgi:hypothetical protein